jgi:2-phosphoglycerate kinase
MRLLQPVQHQRQVGAETGTQGWLPIPVIAAVAGYAPLHLGTDEHPYSKGLMARALMRTGLGVAGAYEVARRVEQDLAATGKRTADFEQMEELAIEVLGEPDGALAIGRLRRYQELDELDMPLIILIGGATGTGKSTVAAEVAYRLGITRVTSTDFVRQTMRALFTPEFLPAIHYSSFDAGRALPTAQEEEVDPLLHGFLEQTRHVLVGVQAAIDRSLEEGWSMVLEGVHLVPGLVEPPPEAEQAVVARCILEIEDPAVHETHFYVRDASSDGLRPVARYLDRFDEIRRIQDELVTRAREAANRLATRRAFIPA